MVKIPLNIKMHQKILMVIGGMMFASFLFMQCMNDTAPKNDPRGAAFAGSEVCLSCHGDLAAGYAHTSHYKTSEAFSYSNLKKLLKSESGNITYLNGQMVSVEENVTDFFQTLYNDSEKQGSERMDLTFGSGEKAQTFGYWRDDQIFQLPLTYLSEKAGWYNSPGFPIDKPYFTRVVPGRCLECHSSYAHATKVQTGPMEISEKFKQQSIVFGIDCERCHGPAFDHVEFHQTNPGEKTARHMTAVKLLSRQQQLDMCGTCHSGDALSLQSIFSFKPGDTLSKYYMYFTGSTGEPDVHGKQMQLMTMSDCFQQSTLTCTTCHDPHTKSNRLTQIQQCLSCHQQPKHPDNLVIGSQDCITCHMPLRGTKSLDFKNTDGTNIPYLLRTHRIAVYPASEWK